MNPRSYSGGKALVQSRELRDKKNCAVERRFQCNAAALTMLAGLQRSINDAKEQQRVHTDLRNRN